MDIYPKGSDIENDIIFWIVGSLFNKAGILISVPLGNRSMEKVEPIIRRFNEQQVRRFDKPLETRENVGFIFVETQKFIDDDDKPGQNELFLELLAIGAKLAPKRLEF